MAIGLSPLRAFLHGLWVYMAAWSTGGFAPMSQNILYYHSLGYEVVTLLFFVTGSFNFALHHAVWSGDRKEMFRNIETVSFAGSLGVLILPGNCWVMTLLLILICLSTKLLSQMPLRRGIRMLPTGSRCPIPGLSAAGLHWMKP